MGCGFSSPQTSGRASAASGNRHAGHAGHAASSAAPRHQVGLGDGRDRPLTSTSLPRSRPTATDPVASPMSSSATAPYPPPARADPDVVMDPRRRTQSVSLGTPAHRRVLHHQQNQQRRQDQELVRQEGAFEEQPRSRSAGVWRPEPRDESGYLPVNPLVAEYGVFSGEFQQEDFQRDDPAVASGGTSRLSHLDSRSSHRGGADRGVEGRSPGGVESGGGGGDAGPPASYARPASVQDMLDFPLFLRSPITDPADTHEPRTGRAAGDRVAPVPLDAVSLLSPGSSHPPTADGTFQRTPTSDTDAGALSALHALNRPSPPARGRSPSVAPHPPSSPPTSDHSRAQPHLQAPHDSVVTNASFSRGGSSNSRSHHERLVPGGPQSAFAKAPVAVATARRPIPHPHKSVTATSFDPNQDPNQNANPGNPAGGPNGPEDVLHGMTTPPAASGLSPSLDLVSLSSERSSFELPSPAKQRLFQQLPPEVARHAGGRGSAGAGSGTDQAAFDPAFMSPQLRSLSLQRELQLQVQSSGENLHHGGATFEVSGPQHLNARAGLQLSREFHARQSGTGSVFEGSGAFGSEGSSLEATPTKRKRHSQASHTHTDNSSPLTPASPMAGREQQHRQVSSQRQEIFGGVRAVAAATTVGQTPKQQHSSGPPPQQHQQQHEEESPSLTPFVNPLGFGRDSDAGGVATPRAQHHHHGHHQRSGGPPGIGVSHGPRLVDDDGRSTPGVPPSPTKSTVTSSPRPKPKFVSMKAVEGAGPTGDFISKYRTKSKSSSSERHSERRSVTAAPPIAPSGVSSHSGPLSVVRPPLPHLSRGVSPCHSQSGGSNAVAGSGFSFGSSGVSAGSGHFGSGGGGGLQLMPNDWRSTTSSATALANTTPTSTRTQKVPGVVSAHEQWSAMSGMQLSSPLSHEREAHRRQQSQHPQQSQARQPQQVQVVEETWPQQQQQESGFHEAPHGLHHRTQRVPDDDDDDDGAPVGEAEVPPPSTPMSREIAAVFQVLQQQQQQQQRHHCQQQQQQHHHQVVQHQETSIDEQQKQHQTHQAQQGEEKKQQQEQQRRVSFGVENQDGLRHEDRRLEDRQIESEHEKPIKPQEDCHVAQAVEQVSPTKRHTRGSQLLPQSSRHSLSWAPPAALTEAPGERLSVGFEEASTPHQLESLERNEVLGQPAGRLVQPGGQPGEGDRPSSQSVHHEQVASSDAEQTSPMKRHSRGSQLFSPSSRHSSSWAPPTALTEAPFPNPSTPTDQPFDRLPSDRVSFHLPQDIPQEHDTAHGRGGSHGGGHTARLSFDSATAGEDSGGDSGQMRPSSFSILRPGARSFDAMAATTRQSASARAASIASSSDGKSCHQILRSGSRDRSPSDTAQGADVPAPESSPSSPKKHGAEEEEDKEGDAPTQSERDAKQHDDRARETAPVATRPESVSPFAGVAVPSRTRSLKD